VTTNKKRSKECATSKRNRSKA